MNRPVLPTKVSRKCKSSWRKEASRLPIMLAAKVTVLSLRTNSSFPRMPSVWATPMKLSTVGNSALRTLNSPYSVMYSWPLIDFGLDTTCVSHSNVVCVNVFRSCRERTLSSACSLTSCAGKDRAPRIWLVSCAGAPGASILTSFCVWFPPVPPVAEYPFAQDGVSCLLFESFSSSLGASLRF